VLRRLAVLDPAAHLARPGRADDSPAHPDRGGATQLMPRALLLTGGSGVGKTTTAQAIGGVLTGAGQTTGVLDLDAVAQFGGPRRPTPNSGLRFSDHLRIDNLAAVWRTYRAAGADFLIASGPGLSAQLRGATHTAVPR